MKVYLFIVFTALGVRCMASNPEDNPPEGQDRPSQFGVLFLMQHNTHTLSFSRLPNVPNCCESFSSGNGYGFSVGVLHSMQIQGDVELVTKLSLSDLSASMTTKEYTFGSQNGATVPMTIEHSIDASLQVMGIEPLVAYRFLNTVTLAAGLNVSYLTTKEYAQKEYLAQPSALVFETGTRYRNERSGSIEETNFIFLAGVLAITSTVPLNPFDTFTLHPELSYLYSFTDILKNYKWKTDAFRIGISLRKVI